MHASATQPTLTEADRAWFGERVDALLPELFGAAVRLCRNRENAEDLVAESLARAWGRLHTLRDRGSFRAWIFRILNNSFVSDCRSADANAVHQSIDATGDEPFSIFERLHAPVLLWWGNPETEFLNRLLRRDLEGAIDALPDVFRPVVVMVDVQGLAYREVADILGIPVGTVRSRLARGRSLLQESLWEHARDAGLAGDPNSNRSETDED